MDGITPPKTVAVNGVDAPIRWLTLSIDRCGVAGRKKPDNSKVSESVNGRCQLTPLVDASAPKASTSEFAEIGRRMEAVRVSLGLSRPALATGNSGLSVRTLENNEGGVNEAKATTLAAYVQAGANANWLLTGEGPMLIRDLAVGDDATYRAAVEAIQEWQIEHSRYLALDKFQSAVGLLIQLADGQPAQIKKHAATVLRLAA